MVLSAVATILIAWNGTTAADPNQALQEINTYRVSVTTKAREEGTRVDFNQLNQKVKEMAEEAIKGVEPAKIEPAKGYAWMQLFVYAEKFEGIEALCAQFMESNPSPQAAFNAEIMCLRAFNELKDYEKGAKVIGMIKPPSLANAATLASYAANLYATPIAEAQGLNAAIQMLDGVLQKLPKTATEDRDKNRLASAVSNVYATQAELQAEHGHKDKPMQTLEAGIADPRVGTAVRTLNNTKTRLTLIGSAAPEIPFTQKYGDFSSLPELKGKVVMVDFMAHWCGPCKAAFPAMVEYYKEAKSRGLEIVSVTRYYGYYGAERDLDQATEFAKMKGFMSEYNITWPMLFTDADSFADYGVSGIPTMAIIGRDGKVELLHVGYSEALWKDLKAKVDKLLAEKE